MFAARVLHLPCARVRVVQREPVLFRERQAKQLSSDVERCGDHVRQREVGPDLRFIEIVHLAASLLGVVAPVGRDNRRVVAAVLRNGLQMASLVRGLRFRRLPYTVEQLPHARGVVRHLVGELEMRKRLEAEQPGRLVAQPHDLGR